MRPTECALGKEKRSFTPTGDMNNLDIRQRNHLDARGLGGINNTFVSLMGGFLPAPRWWWPLGAGGAGGAAEQLAFAVPESSDDFTFDSCVAPAPLPPSVSREVGHDPHPTANPRPLPTIPTAGTRSSPSGSGTST